MLRDSFYADGLRFSCTRCSLCCRFDTGYVFLSRHDLYRLADHFACSEQEIRNRYCRHVETGLAPRVSLREQANFDCVFWIDGECSVYEARPLQCRSYPFWPPTLSSRANWNAERRYCPGINSGPLRPAEYISALLAQRRNEPFLEE